MNEFEICKKRDQLIIKKNSLITKTKFNLSLNEQKILLYIISKIKPEDDKFNDVIFTIQEFCTVFNLNTSGKNYQRLKKDIQSLRDKSFWIEKEKEEILVSWINKAIIKKNTGEVIIKLDNELKDYLLNLKEQYTLYSLHDIFCFNSKYTIRLYELICAEKFKHHFEIEIERLKKMLFLPKTKKNDYLKNNVMAHCKMNLDF